MSEHAGTIRQGERAVFVFNFPVTGGGSASVAGTPTVAVYDYYSGTVLRSGTAVTGATSGSATTPQAWINFDTIAPGTVPLGWLSLVCSGSVTGSDGMTRLEEPKVDLLVVSPWEG